MNILFCGDIMPGGVLAYQKEYIDKGVFAYMQKFDLRVGTLEAAIGTNLSYDKIKMQERCNIVYARDEDFFRIKEMGVNVVSLANNHVFDLGEEGLRNTIRLLEENGIQYCGAGMDIDEASKPAVAFIRNKSIAILACCMYGNVYLGHVEQAGKNKPGVNPLDIDRVVANVREAKRKYDYVFVMPHWGKEYQYFPMAECKMMAYKMIDAGADGVIGSHAHNIQPVIKYNSKYIYFGLGNFLFPDYYMQPPRPIWYPDEKVDLHSIKKVIGYPFPIEQPIISVWNGRSRIGMLAEFKFDKDSGWESKYRFSYLSADNVIYFYECFNVNLKRFRMYWMGKVIKSDLYGIFLKYYDSKFNLLRRSLHLFSRLLNINYDVKV